MVERSAWYALFLISFAYLKVWGWFVASFFILTVGIAMGELASSMPTRYINFRIIILQFLVAACTGGLSIFRHPVSVDVSASSSAISTPSESAAVFARSTGEAPLCLPRLFQLPKMATGLLALVKFIAFSSASTSSKVFFAARSPKSSPECKMSLSSPTLPSSSPHSSLSPHALPRPNEIPRLTFSAIGKI
jgi:hypothetical protein